MGLIFVVWRAQDDFVGLYFCGVPTLINNIVFYWLIAAALKTISLCFTHNFNIEISNLISKFQVELSLEISILKLYMCKA